MGTYTVGKLRADTLNLDQDRITSLETRATALEAFQLVSRLTADTTPVNNSSVLVASGLSVTAAANTVYDMELHLYYNGPSAAPDLLVGFTFPSGATALINQLGVNAADAGFNVGSAQPQTTQFQFGSSASVDRAGLLKAQWIVSSTGGAIAVTFAQVTPTAVNTLLRAGSRLILQKIA